MTRERLGNIAYGTLMGFILALCGYIYYDSNIVNTSIGEDERSSVSEAFETVLTDYSALSRILDLGMSEAIRLHRGGVLIIDGTTAELSSLQFGRFPRGLIATRPEDVKTLVVVDRDEELIFTYYQGGLRRSNGTYTQGVPVYREVYFVRTIDTVKRVTLSSTELSGPGGDVFPDRAAAVTVNEEGGAYRLESTEDGRRSRMNVVVLTDENGEPYGIRESAGLDVKVREYIAKLWDRESWPAVAQPRTSYTQIRAAAEHGDAEAQHSMGEMYRTGQGVPQDRGEALRWYRLAAEQGLGRAQFELGLAYDYGQGVPQDRGEVLRWYRLAAEQGLGRARHELGLAYDYGRGVPQDRGEALRWYRLAAEQGFVGSQVNLAVAYRTGQGVPQDRGEALRWYRLAAEQGFANAQFNLGEVYLDGRGVPQDYVRAYVWTSLAEASYVQKYRPENVTKTKAISDSRDAVRNRDYIGDRMTADQINEAQRLAREWTPKSWDELKKGLEAKSL